MPLEDLQSLIIDCVRTGLKYDPPSIDDKSASNTLNGLKSNSANSQNIQRGGRNAK